MKQSLYQLVVSPYGERYNNIADSGLILNTEISETDYIYSNRLGVIETLPLFETPLKVGDIVVVHHNIFRRFNDVRGKLKNGGAYIDDNMFTVGFDSVFAYKRKDKWIAIADYCFIQPIDNDDRFEMDRFKTHHGTVAIGNPSLEEQGIVEGDTIGFTPDSEYEFTVDGKLMYKMSTKDIAYKCI